MNDPLSGFVEVIAERVAQRVREILAEAETPAASDGLISERQAALRLGVGQSTLRDWRQAGRIKAYQLAGSRRCWRYDPSELDAFRSAWAQDERQPRRKRAAL